MYSSLLKIFNKEINTLNKTNINNKSMKNNTLIDNNYKNNNELLKFLRIIKDESKINSIGFYDIHNIAKKRKLSFLMKKDDIIKKIRTKGFKAENTHFLGVGIRSNIPYNRLFTLLKE